MNRTTTQFLLPILLVLILTGCNKKQLGLTSPAGELTVNVFVVDGNPAYSILKDNIVVLDTSKLGLTFDGVDLSKDLTITSISSIVAVNDEYEMLHGKQRVISYQANEQVFSFQHKSGLEYTVTFRVSDDGVGFRYTIQGEDDDIHHITEEFTSFNFLDNSRAWLQYMANAKTGFARTNPSYEENYSIDIEVGTPAPDTAGWVFPALFKTGENWVLISESGLDGSYPGTKLHQYSNGGNYKIDFPQWGEQFPGGALNPESTLPWSTPWRIIAIGDLETITESTLGTDLAEPAVEMDTDWIKPGRSSWSWVKLGDNATVYDVQVRFIDYAADMGWEYVLVDAYWDRNIGYDKMQELIDYAAIKEVGILLWYNSSGSWNDTEMTPKSALLTHEGRVKEFSRIHTMGVKGIKVDFFAGDGQSMIQYYLDIFKDAADHKLLMNTHGTTLPRGWHRTYPNLMTMESIKGFEFITFFQGNADQAAKHSTMLPFTRNVFSPMDFTPMSPTSIRTVERKTTPAFEIATPVLFTSGIQHYAETDEGMEQIPDYVQNFIKKIPVDWDEMEFIDGYPGKFVVIARRDGNTWFVAGINGENESKKLTLDLSFIPKTLSGTFITDGTGSEMFAQRPINPSGNISIILEANGGFVMLFEE
tara:strand:+ start:50762 stop:52699 length:1938 start_codon:yes stop_codon:yes gene_type:complete